MEEKFQSTLEKEDFLKKAGYEVRTMWECELKKEMHVNSELSDFIKTVSVNEPCDPREGFYGGRTEPIRLYHKRQEGEKIKYIDVCR